MWIAGKECQRTLYVESGGQPASKSAWLDHHANEIANTYFVSTLPVLENAWLRQRFAGFEHFQVKALEIVGESLSSHRPHLQTLSHLNELYKRHLEQRL
jgi:multiple sugar transport system substrate-binding protein